MAGPLGVSHLLLFSRSTSGNTNLRLALTPRGPTLHFRVEKYSLCKDVQKAQKRPKAGGKDYLSPPLLVMNNFTSPNPSEGPNPTPLIPKHLETLTTTIFQSLFPPISPQTTPLTSIRRVLLLNREIPSPTTTPPSATSDSGTYTLNLRHYAITTKRTGLSPGIRRLHPASTPTRPSRKTTPSLPSLRHLSDIADYILDPSAGYTSASESEADPSARIEVLTPSTLKPPLRPRVSTTSTGTNSRTTTRNGDRNSATTVEKRAVRLVELGPRLRLRMMKVEEGVCAGKVLWHEYVRKSGEEERRVEGVWEGRRREREGRRRGGRGEGERKKVEVEVEDGEMDGEDEWDSEEAEGDAEMNDDDEEEEEEADAEQRG